MPVSHLRTTRFFKEDYPELHVVAAGSLLEFALKDLGDWNSGPPTSVAIVALIICCGLPFFIVAIVLWFRYKNKQAKYKLAAEALAAGRTIPAELFNDPEEQGNAVMTKGIKNIFLGIGLGVFLWVLTEEEGLAAIGFLIFCMGLGQVLIAYTTTPHKKKKDDPFPPTRINQDENLWQTII